MAARSSDLTQQPFGGHAAGCLSSDIRPHDKSLERLTMLVEAKPGWRILDVATGAGHTARALADASRLVVAADVTHRRLALARERLQDSGAERAYVCQHDAAHLPYPGATFDLVTCRSAAHHFRDPAAFVHEAARVLKPGGWLALTDSMVSGEPRIAQFVNTLEKLRDPSHHWAYSADDWQTFFFSAGLDVVHSELFEQELDFDDWASRLGVDGDDYTRLRALLEQAPQAPREWLHLRRVGRRLLFRRAEGLVVGRKR